MVEPPNKRKHNIDDMPGTWLDQLTAVVRGQMQELLEPLKLSVSSLSQQCATNTEEIQSLHTTTTEPAQQINARLLAVETNKDDASHEGLVAAGSNASMWLPSCVEVKAMCEYAGVSSKGSTRNQAVAALTVLTEGLHEALRQHVGDVTLRGARGSAMRIPVAKHFCREVAGVWKEMVKSGKVSGVDIQGSCEVARTVVQPSPHREKLNGRFGKIVRLVESTVFRNPDLEMQTDRVNHSCCQAGPFDSGCGVA
eukprot:TRINITY_DN73524_c0_g1_i1.p1 TRINITY_DN73524_c0_g1~~TRINITY_DN73524_c0_g1_i1.p1  ORF type:complete len:253 (-),score=34.16 TRINITY_DN73524_c0_g1_i1:559-1317(-)